MNGKRHKPPSRIRYETNNPVFSVRMPKAWHDRLNQMLEASNQSRKDFLAQALGIKTESYEAMKQNEYNEVYNAGYNEGWKKGYKDGEKNRFIRLYCLYCDTIQDFPLSTVYDRLVELSKEYMSLYCANCKKKYGFP